MLREERIQFILEQLRKDRRLSTTLLMSQFDVTEGTIRRDLNELQSKGLLKKVHGGAIPAISDPPSLSGRIITDPENKVQLAKKAISLVKEGQVLLIDGGSSNLALIKQLPKNINLRIFTNNIPAASLLLTFPNVETHLLGGKVLTSSEVTLDLTTYEQVSSLKADMAFIGVRSIHPEYGIATLSIDEAGLKRKMCESADHVVVMVTNEKLYTRDQFSIGPIDLVDTIVLESSQNEHIISNFTEKGIHVI